jgi:hypothetical protein
MMGADLPEGVNFFANVAEAVRLERRGLDSFSCG